MPSDQQHKRGRLEESIFGGFTQDMLNERRVSLFLFH